MFVSNQTILSHQGQKLPPMLRLYLDYKKRYQDSLLFFQVGDFYELFFDDAIEASKALNLTLTSRDKNSENPVPMCGVPVAAADSYLNRLVDKGFTVAVVKQIGDPKTSKGMVERALDRIISPGVRILSSSDKDHRENYIAAVVPGFNEYAIAFSDVRTGKIFVKEAIEPDLVCYEIMNIDPSEIILPAEHAGKKVDKRLRWVREIGKTVREGTTIKFREISSSFHSREEKISGYSALDELAKKALRLLISYVDETTAGAEIAFLEVSHDTDNGVVAIDSATRRHLELVENCRDLSSTGTLFSEINFTSTAGGSRLLRRAILKPLAIKEEIAKRLNLVELLVENKDLRELLQERLRELPDLERIATRIELKAVTPAELGSVRDGLKAALKIKERLTDMPCKNPPQMLIDISEGLSIPQECLNLLSSSLVDTPPYSLSDGSIFREGYNAELDRLRKIGREGKGWFASYETAERNRTGIASLKVKYNSVFGYFIEVSKANLAKVPQDYIRKQTMANAERFFTRELKEREDEVLGAESRRIDLEKDLFTQLKESILPFASSLRSIGNRLSLLDLTVSLAECSCRKGWVKPRITDSNTLNIKNGYHPVIASSMGSEFVPNSLVMTPDDGIISVLTGPNMGGKSTFLRQNALIVILAQMGSYVPAESAEIGIVDKIFTRIGASDNLLEGESTFMVEMKEVAHILAKATPRSFLLIDELGRGTATEDGLAIAQSVIEWIAEHLSCRTLFATHFHDLTELETSYPFVSNLSVGCLDRDGQIIFTHKVNKTPADRSYGVEVAKLAGLPQEIISRAEELIASYCELKRPHGIVQNNSRQLSFFRSDFQAPRIPADYTELKLLKEKIQKVDPMNMTPLEAISFLAKLRDNLL